MCLWLDSRAAVCRFRRGAASDEPLLAQQRAVDGEIIGLWLGVQRDRLDRDLLTFEHAECGGCRIASRCPDGAPFNQVAEPPGLAVGDDAEPAGAIEDHELIVAQIQDRGATCPTLSSSSRNDTQGTVTVGTAGRGAGSSATGAPRYAVATGGGLAGEVAGMRDHNTSPTGSAIAATKALGMRVRSVSTLDNAAIVAMIACRCTISILIDGARWPGRGRRPGCDVGTTTVSRIVDPTVHLDAIGRPVMDNILRFPSAVKHDPAIDRWLRAQRDDLRPFAETWFAHMRRCGSDVRELMHDGCPTACVGDAAFGYVNAFKAHVNVGLFFGALLEDPAGLLEGTGKRGRHVKLRPGRDVDPTALARLIDAAYVDIRARLRT